MRGLSTICAFIRSEAISSLGVLAATSRTSLEINHLFGIRSFRFRFESPGSHDGLTWLGGGDSRYPLAALRGIQGVDAMRKQLRPLFLLALLVPAFSLVGVFAVVEAAQKTQAIKATRWSDRATWPDRKVPRAG